MTEIRDVSEVPSRSARKREVQEKRPLVERLLAMNERALQALDLPEELLSALVTAQKIKRGSAKQRQIRVVVQLVHSLDDGEIAARADALPHRPSAGPAPRVGL